MGEAVPYYQTYVVSNHTRQLIESWKQTGDARPEVFIVAPSIRDVGEQQLIGELTDASYALGRHHDVRRRHFLSRIFPINAAAEVYGDFLDAPFLTAEITDGFFGVDNIDLTQWLGKDIADHSAEWQILLAHINAHPETDFVFCAFTDKEEQAEALIAQIIQDTGVAIDTVSLSYPGPEELTDEFIATSGREFLDQKTAILSQFQTLSRNKKRMNYAFARSCALYALRLLALSDDKDGALAEAFQRYETLEPTIKRTRTIGF